jgi:hypothetical protein
MRRFASTVVIAAAFFTAQLSQQTAQASWPVAAVRAHLLPAHSPAAHRGWPGWGPCQIAWGQQTEKCFLFLEQKTLFFNVKFRND